MAPFSKKKSGKREVLFQVHLHSLEPWPQQVARKPLTIAWERGSSHKGGTEPSQPRGQRDIVYEFEETLAVPCTLVQVLSSTPLSRSETSALRQP